MMHFAEAGIALVVAGASILTIAGLVRESLRDGGGHLHLFPDALDHDEDDHPELRIVRLSETSTTDDAGLFIRAQEPSGLTEAETATPDTSGPVPHSRGSGRRDKMNSPVEDRAARKQRKEKRRSKKRNGTDGRAEALDCGTAAEAEDA